MTAELMVRLVKGAYWDTEIKRAQERGLDGYPVFTRKAMTDLNYVACASKAVESAAAHLPAIRHPQRADGRDRAGACAGAHGGFEFQRLHGMGEALYEQLAKDHPEIAYRTYAPVGSHRDLLAYLVRRLLENGANSSFVAQAADYRVPVTALLQRPADAIVRPQQAAHPKIPLPGDLFAPERRNSRGVEFGARAALDRLLAEVKAEAADLKPITEATPDQANAAVAAARAGFAAWSRTPAATRAAALEQAAHLSGEPRAPISSRCCKPRAARRSTMRCRSCARPPTSAAIMPRRAESCSATMRRCRARPARAMRSPCAAAASSSRSRPGIFRWRSSSARSRRH